MLDLHQTKSAECRYNGVSSSIFMCLNVTQRYRPGFGEICYLEFVHHSFTPSSTLYILNPIFTIHRIPLQRIYHKEKLNALFIQQLTNCTFKKYFFLESLFPGQLQYQLQSNYITRKLQCQTPYCRVPAKWGLQQKLPWQTHGQHVMLVL